jgi:hypothetical protein
MLSCRVDPWPNEILMGWGRRFNASKMAKAELQTEFSKCGEGLPNYSIDSLIHPMSYNYTRNTDRASLAPPILKHGPRKMQTN